MKEGNTSSFNTVFNGLNAISGISIVTMPYALASGGWVSLPLLIIIAMAATFSEILIQRCLEVNPNIKSYSDIGELAYGKAGRVVISILLYVEMYMVATGFLILEGDNLHKLFPGMSIHVPKMMPIAGNQGFVVIIGLVLLPTVWLDDLNILAYASAGSVFTSIIMLGSIVCLGAFDGIGFHDKGKVLNIRGIPTALSLYMVCYSAHPVFPTLYLSMKNKHFSKVMVLCFMLCTIGYALMAIFGYLMFGRTVKSQITLDLPIRQVSSQVAIYTIVITPLAKYALMLKPIAMDTEAWFPLNYQTKKAFKITIRTILVGSQVGVALGVPYFGYLMSLVGALLSTTGSLTIPCICYWKIVGTKWGAEVFAIIGILFLGSVIIISGTYTSIVEVLGAIKG